MEIEGLDAAWVSGSLDGYWGFEESPGWVMMDGFLFNFIARGQECDLYS